MFKNKTQSCLLIASVILMKKIDVQEQNPVLSVNNICYLSSNCMLIGVV